MLCLSRSQKALRAERPALLLLLGFWPLIGKSRFAHGAAEALHSCAQRLLLLALLPSAGQLLAAELSSATGAPTDTITASARIDEWLLQRLDQAGVAPAPLADDATYLKRLHLDLCGTIPLAAEVKAFLADPNPRKRQLMADRLLDSPAFHVHMATTWRRLMLASLGDSADPRAPVALQSWLQTEFRQHTRYDRLVSEVVTASGNPDTGPASFLLALQLKPEKMATETARLFLGLQIGCAECHDHPFDHWKQRDFWAYAAFFSRLGPPVDPDQPRSIQSVVEGPSGEVQLPGTQEAIPPRFPGSQENLGDGAGSRRQELAIWLASRDNPYMARAAANWAWQHLFGRGLVHPMDDLGEHNPPSHPELFQFLASHLIEQQFDMRELLRTLVNTQAYQRSSAWKDENPPPPQLFAYMQCKPLTPEQTYDSLRRFLLDSDQSRNPAGPGGRLLSGERLEFVQAMQSQGRDRLEQLTTLSQSLLMMNGGPVQVATTPGTSRLLLALEAPWMDDAERIDWLCLSVLSRYPSESERAMFADYIAQARSRQPVGVSGIQPFADLTWAMLNSAEFSVCR